MNCMEEFDTEKYNSIESIESLFQRINRFTNEYNYCFGCFTPPSLLPVAFGIVGGIINKVTSDNITGYFVNYHNRGICLIPLIVDDNKVIQIDIYGYIDIRNEDIKQIKIKTEDFIYKRITIVLKDKTKYTMMTSKKIKGVIKHEKNLKCFIELCNKKK